MYNTTYQPTITWAQAHTIGNTGGVRLLCTMSMRGNGWTYHKIEFNDQMGHNYLNYLIMSVRGFSGCWMCAAALAERHQNLIIENS